MAFIEINSVTKKYGDFKALDAVTISVDEGEFVSLLGPSGCGKTSLLRSIAGLETIQGGSIVVNGRTFSQEDLTLPPERRNVGLIFQSYALWPHMTVFKNIAYGLKLQGIDRSEISRRVDEALGIVGLDGLESRFPSELSGGQMQRVAVARSVAARPAVLLFDEPLSNLDAKLRESMRFELRRIQKEVGITAVYVTHDQAEAMVISDRIILMNKGSVVQQGSARMLYERPATTFASEFLGFSNFLRAKVTREADEHGVGEFLLMDIDCGPVEGILREGCSPGEEVHLSVRPESLFVRRDPRRVPGTSAALPGVVQDVVYAGNLCDVFVDVSGQRIRAQVRPMELVALTPGLGVDVCFDASDAWAVPFDERDKG